MSLFRLTLICRLWQTVSDYIPSGAGLVPLSMQFGSSSG